MAPTGLSSIRKTNIKVNKRERYTILSLAASCIIFAAVVYLTDLRTAACFGIVLLFVPIIVNLQMKEKLYSSHQRL